MSVKASIVRDTEGFPVLAVATQGAQKIEIVYEKDSGFTLSGSRRSLENQALINALNLIYPAEDRAVLNIPQPLAVTNVQGGIVLFDDMEALLKWSAGALDNTFAYNGSQSLKVALAGGAATTTTRYFPMPSSKKLIAEVVFAVDDFANFVGVDSLNFQILHDDGDTLRQANVQFDRTGPVFYIYGTTAYNAQIPFLPTAVAGVHGAWHKLRINVDFSTNRWVYFEFDNFRWELPNLPLEVAATTSALNSRISFRGHAGAGGANFWIDDALVREA